MPEPDPPDAPPAPAKAPAAARSRKPAKPGVRTSATATPRPAAAAPAEVELVVVPATDLTPVQPVVGPPAPPPVERRADALQPGAPRRSWRGTPTGLAGLGLALVALVVVGVVLSRAVSGDGGGPELTVGGCYDLDDIVVESAQSVDCAQPHELQVLSELTVDVEAYPGPSGLRQQADEQCNSEAAAFVTGRSVPEGLGYGFVVPTQESWERGDRTITCTLVSTTGEPLTGTIG